MDILSIKPGSVVLDLACGKGAYSIFLAGIIGKKGLVYAIDLWKDGLVLLEEQIKTKKITNIMTLHADATKPLDIDDYSVDVCLMATVLHNFKKPIKRIWC